MEMQMLQLHRFAPVFKVPTFIKWAGGKSQLSKVYFKLFTEKIDGYLEPFLGSGSVFFFVRQNYQPKHSVISDSNFELIAAFKAVRDQPEQLISLLEQHKSKHSKEYYYSIREQMPKLLSELEQAARFIYLNKTCFNGLYRVNGGGRFNVPMGDYKKPGGFLKKNIFEASKLLQGAVIQIAPFEKTCA